MLAEKKVEANELPVEKKLQVEKKLSTEKKVEVVLEVKPCIKNMWQT